MVSRPRIGQLRRRLFGKKVQVGIAIPEKLRSSLKLLAELEGVSVGAWLERRILCSIESVIKSGYFTPDQMRGIMESLYGRGVTVGDFLSATAYRPLAPGVLTSDSVFEDEKAILPEEPDTDSDEDLDLLEDTDEQTDE